MNYKLGILLTILTTIITPLTAQTKFNYEAAWQKVDSLLKNNLPKSAMEEVDNIYSQSKKDGADAQNIKSLIYKSRLIQQVEENDWLKNIRALEDETASAKEPSRQILHSITADLYWDYFQNQRWKIYDRSNTVNFIRDDPATWTNEDFQQVIMYHYKFSLENSALLQKTKPDNYYPVIIKGNQEKLRPTLYDLLANTAIDYFKTSEPEITKPSYRFELDDQANLAPFKNFIQYHYESKDSSSNELFTIRLYQDLLRFHANDADKAAFVNADIERIQYAYANSVSPYRKQLYKEALENIYIQFPKLPEAMQAGYLLAQWWKEKGDNYNAATGIAVDKFAYQQAELLCMEIAKKFPDSEGGINAVNMLNMLQMPSLSMQVEKVNTIAEPFRALITFKNTNGIFIRIIKLDDLIEQQLNNDNYKEQDAFWKKLAKLPYLQTWKQDLPSFNDLRVHSTEIKIDGLPNGKYIIASSSKNDFSTGLNVMASAIFYTSNISYVNSNNQFFILHRQTGKPLANATVQVWNTSYDYTSRKTTNKKDLLLKTDKNGLIQLPDNSQSDNYNTNIKLEITHNNDHLFITDDYYYPRTFSPANEQQNKSDAELVKYFLFTDRSIYRPGQTVYFKAIGILPHAQNGGGLRGSSLYLTNAPVTIELHNANNELVDTLRITPNEYGSINGTFKLPENGLTGNFTIKVNVPQYSATTFNVEEYKRPKFYIEFEKLKGSYALNDTITVSGYAKAYAGNNIDGAMVKYHVKRQTKFLYPWLFRTSGKSIWPPYSKEEMEITHGEATTDANGKFTVRFIAIPDRSTSKSLDPTFEYTVEADVTDINGETRSSNNVVSVGYKSMVINISIPGKFNQIVDSLKTIGISTSNLSGETVPSDVQVKIYALQTPKRLIRERYWDAPDTTVMGYDEFVRNFPHDEYRDENDYRTWQKGKLLQSTNINTSKDQTLKLNTLEAGYYKVEALTHDSAGNAITAIDYFSLTDIKKKLLPAPLYNASTAIKSIVEPGEKATFMQATSAGDLFIVQQTTKAGKSYNDKAETAFDYQALQNDITVKTFETSEDDRGGYSVNRFFIKDNRFYTADWFVNVPYTNKDLKISFETFRDKLLPGQQETWKLKISGYKSDAVAAEMLASMYDASLDQFMVHTWNKLDLWHNNSFSNYWSGKNNFTNSTSMDGIWKPYAYLHYEKTYDRLLTIGNSNQPFLRGAVSLLEGKAAGISVQDSQVMDIADTKMGVISQEGIKTADISAAPKTEQKQEELPVATMPGKAIQIRKNFNETAFFFPALHTSTNGEIVFSFTIPEALTQWKLQTLVHTKDLATALATRTVITQKQLMVQPNAPRFFRQGDTLTIITKIVNLSDSNLSGNAVLQLMDPATMQVVGEGFNNNKSIQNFSVEKGKSIAVSFPFNIPVNYTGALMYRIVARAGNASDGEEMALPVLANRMLVTESFPLNLKGTGSKQFTWNKLLKSGDSKTLQNQSLTVEYTSNPAWYAIQSLPYLMEYPYDCAEQTWNRFYANAIATKIANSTPKIKAVFEQWKNVDTAALLSNLQKNQELKSILLEETPWVLQATSEVEQRKNIGLLFDLVRMSNEAAKTMNKLQEMQSPNGGFNWFKGGPDDRYMTQYILTGIGHLKRLDAWPASQTNPLNKIIQKALPYLDARLKDDYDNLIKYKADLKKNNLSSIAIQWLYMRSFFDAPVAGTSQKSYEYYTAQAKKFWPSLGKYEQGMIALALHRMNDPATPKAILKSLTENSIASEEFGMYWKEFNNAGYYWWQAPVESQSLLIEAYSEIENNQARVDNLKTWLLKQKQTQNWSNTKATAEACYALLLQGNQWLNNESVVTIQLGNQSVSPSKTEAGTGYFRQTIQAKNVSPAMGNISVNVSSPNKTGQPGKLPGWGSVYWQYFEDLDKITPAVTPMSLKKQLFIIRNSDRGPVITPVNDKEVLKVGDQVKVRIELRTDRNLEYVHLKDMRAACFEPVNVLSSYKYQDGLSYYESTRDASTNFFISYLSKGTYVFEYELVVTHAGNFSNGISSIQCMYAPEFSSHSEGIRIMVK